MGRVGDPNGYEVMEKNFPFSKAAIAILPLDQVDLNASGT